MAEKENVVIEPATEADLDELSKMLGELFAQESDFRPDKDKQLRGLRLIFEQPSRGRVFVLRRNGAIVGMINLLFTISTAEGGFVMLLEDLVVHTQYQGQGYGNKLLEHAIDFAKKKNFPPNHAADRSARKCGAGVFPEAWLRRFFDDSDALVDQHPERGDRIKQINRFAEVRCNKLLMFSLPAPRCP